MQDDIKSAPILRGVRGETARDRKALKQKYSQTMPI